MKMKKARQRLVALFCLHHPIGFGDFYFCLKLVQEAVDAKVGSVHIQAVP